MSAAAAQVGPEARRQSAFGGLVPSAAVARGEGTLAAVLAVELHADGAVLPLLVLSDAPGVLGWDIVGGLTVTDDAGTQYAVSVVAQSAGLGALQATAWIEPSPPPQARAMTLTVSGLTRTSTSRRGAVERPLVDEQLVLALRLMPERTTTETPEEPPEGGDPLASSRAPARSLGAFSDLVPIGQARVDPDGAVCLWAVERYAERSVLTMATITEDRVEIEELAPGIGCIEVWDDVGTRYTAMPIHGASRATWMETSVELTPAIPNDARSLGVRLSELPARSGESEVRPLAGPFTYGIALPA